MGPSSSPLRVLTFRPSKTPHYLNSKHLPLSAQHKLSAVMEVYDRLMVEDPVSAIAILELAEMILTIRDTGSLLQTVKLAKEICLIYGASSNADGGVSEAG